MCYQFHFIPVPSDWFTEAQNCNMSTSLATIKRKKEIENSSLKRNVTKAKYPKYIESGGKSL